MSHTNSTTNYGLPQFLTSDKPAWLTDVNNAFSDIDTAIYNAQTKADTAYTDAGNAQLDATTAINNAAAADAKGSGAIASIEANFDPTTIYSVGAKVIYNSLLYRCIVAVVTPGPWTGSNNWERITVDSLISTTDSKIGFLSSLSTTDKTSIVNALNEVVSNKSNVLVTEQFSSSFSVSANADVVVNFDITKTGYTPLAVVFYTIANKDCFPHAIILNNSNTATFHISNISSSAKTNISATATVLFVKN